MSLNAVQGGLNFLVPSFWWGELLEKNANSLHIPDLILPDSGPLDILIDLQIVRLSLEVYEAEFDSLIDDSVSASRTVARDLRTAQEAEEPREKGKRGKPVCSWWKNESRELSYPHKVLFSPYVCNETLATIGMEEFSWVVVTPSLYRLFSKHELFLKGEPYDRLVVGIPVVLESAHYPPTLTYDLSSTEIRRVELYSFNRCSYAFVGHVEAK